VAVAFTMEPAAGRHRRARHNETLQLFGHLLELLSLLTNWAPTQTLGASSGMRGGGHYVHL
jgi:hypothetical protein